MGAVYLSEQIAVGNRPVAVKVLSRKLLDDPNFLPVVASVSDRRSAIGDRRYRRFLSKAASTGRIHHPNVVTIHESGQTDDGTPYIAMEFLEGESLRQAMRRRGPLPVAEVAEILRQASVAQTTVSAVCGFSPAFPTRGAAPADRLCSRAGKHFHQHGRN